MKYLRKYPFLGPLVAVVVVYVIFAILAPGSFTRAENLTTMAGQTVVVGIAASGMTLVILLGGIDLSVGSNVALSTVVCALCLKEGAPAILAAAAAMASGLAAGLLNGALVTTLRITPFIVTLGTMRALRGLAKGLADEQKIDAPSSGIEALVAPLPPGYGWALFPPGVWIMLATSALVAAMLVYTKGGRHIMAIGSNEATARLCGVRVERVKWLVYGLAGLFAGLAGVMEFSTLTVGDPTDSMGLELEVIAAVVIGGGSLAGGEGSVAGALFGALLMTVIRTGSTYLGIENWVQDIVTGGIVVTAVALDRARRASETRR
ncbi:ABC transporter permease [Polyangium sp. y55x31]|uniref:ABC transporter permease n=1 Tax=Polyangium sp. y55x31 TaxID=3042688 RepID=UPI00248250DC|nr:ABC transporter permease [Polyangium sp. y55x31]MDI1476011.1 ABC transporter permease [Polyangium sp. y55x31]